MCLPFLKVVVLLDLDFLVFPGVLADRRKWKVLFMAVYTTAAIFDFSVEGLKNYLYEEGLPFLNLQAGMGAGNTWPYWSVCFDYCGSNCCGEPEIFYIFFIRLKFAKAPWSPCRIQMANSYWLRKNPNPYIVMKDISHFMQLVGKRLRQVWREKGNTPAGCRQQVYKALSLWREVLYLGATDL